MDRIVARGETMDAAKTGGFIASLRREQGLTQQQLADRLHVTYKAVSRWETGRGTPDIDNLEALSRELEIGIAELLNGERFEDPMAPVQTEQVVQTSISLFQQLLRRNAVYRAVLGFFAGAVAILLAVIYLTSPTAIPYSYGLIQVAELSDGTLVAICSEETSSIETKTIGGNVYLSCTVTRWNQLTGHRGLNAAVVGNARNTVAVLYYPGMQDYSCPRGDVVLYGTVYGNVITLPKLAFSTLLTACCVLSIAGLAVYAILVKRWYAQRILRVALVPVCFTASIIAVLWGKFDQVYNAAFYFSGICLVAICIYAIALAVLSRMDGAAAGGSGGAGLLQLTRILVFASCVVIAATVVAVQVDTTIRYRYLSDSGMDSLDYSVNEAGQTYGSGSDRVFEEQPDLVLVEGNDGVVGYVYADDLWGEEPTSIEEALESNSELPRDIPVYESDGVTAIGTFTIGAG